jgi:hypothetical protein
MPGSVNCHDGNEGSLNLCSVYVVGALLLSLPQSSTPQHAGTVRDSYPFEARNCLTAFLFTEEAPECFSQVLPLRLCNYWSAYIFTAFSSCNFHLGSWQSSISQSPSPTTPLFQHHASHRPFGTRRLFVTAVNSIIHCDWPAPGTFSDVTILTPSSNYPIPRTLYARTLLLNQNCEHDNVLLATWENYSPEPPYFPIFRSTDLGRTWTEFSIVIDQANGWSLRYQPFLYELPQAIGKFPAGTVLLAENPFLQIYLKLKLIHMQL